MHRSASNQPLVLSAGRAAWIWGFFVVAVIAGTIPQLLTNVAIFKIAGKGFHRLLLIVLPMLFAAPLAYHWLRLRPLRLRLRGLWEPLILAALAITPALARAPRALLVILVFTASCHVIGLCLLRVLRLEIPAVSARLPVSTAAGTAIFSVVLFAAGIGEAGRPEVFLALFTLPLVLGWRLLRASAVDIERSARAWVDRLREPNPVIGVALFFLGIFVFLTALTAITPATNGDAVRMHLSLAKFYAQSGALTAPPFLDYAYYPQSFEIMMAALWALGGQAAAQMLNPMQFAMTQLLLYGIGRSLGMSAPAAMLGTALGAMTPFLHWTGSVVKNDMGLVLYLLCALLGYLFWIRERTGGWICLSVLFVAAAFGVKHTALFGAVPLGVLTLYALWHQWRLAALALALLAVPPGVWYARTWRAKGQPAVPRCCFFRRATQDAACRLPEQSRTHRDAAMDSPFQRAAVIRIAHTQSDGSGTAPVAPADSAGPLPRSGRSHADLLVLRAGVSCLLELDFGMIRYAIAPGRVHGERLIPNHGEHLIPRWNEKAGSRGMR